MVLVNLGRKLGIDSEAALRAASAKFAARFAHVERLADEQEFNSRICHSMSSMSCGRRLRWQLDEHRWRSVQADGRTPGQLRKVRFQLDVQKWAEGSCTIEMGDTRVLCAATIEERVPPHLRGKGLGWVTAEYNMLPRATAERTQREVVKGRQGGRTMEIQRLIGRALRGVVDTSKIGDRTVTVDCDVLQADGGTRTASITGGYVALALALRKIGAERRARRPDRGGQRGHRRRRAAARPRLLGGLARRGRLQRRRHGQAARTSSSRARRRASHLIAIRWTGCSSLPMAGCSSSSDTSARSSASSNRVWRLPRPRGGFLASLPRRSQPAAS